MQKINESNKLMNYLENSNYCYYSVIVAVSKRAREIVETAQTCPDNPVLEASREFENGEFKICLPNETEEN